jgi:hypothetical protein
MPKTPNHGYNVPNAGAENWHVPLNENFEQYDTDIEIRDTEDNLSGYEPKEGAKFLATDTGKLFVGDGSAWTPSLALGRYTPLSGNDNSFSRSLVFGHPANAVTPGVSGATIGGGGSKDHPNEVAVGDLSTIGGGVGNTAKGNVSTIGGGGDNTTESYNTTVGGGFKNTAKGALSTVGGGRGNNARREGSTVSGGQDNEARGFNSTISGGSTNFADADFATVGGGVQNSATGRLATVPGGGECVAAGDYSFAAGFQAEAIWDHTFVWSGAGSGAPFEATASNQFLVSAPGGVGLGTNAPAAPLDVAGDNNWDVASGEGDLRVGNADDRFVVGVALGGTGAGTTRLRAKSANGTPRLTLGAGSDTVTITDGAVEPVGDGGASLGTASTRWSTVYAQSGTVSTSDARLKTDVQGLEGGLDRVRELNPVSYRWDRDHDDAPRDNGQRLGFLAQEVAAVVPEAVVEPDDEDERGDGDSDDYYGLNYDAIVPVLTTAIKEQQATIDEQDATLADHEAELMRKADHLEELEAENDALRDRLADLEARVGAMATAGDQYPVATDGGGPLAGAAERNQ